MGNFTKVIETSFEFDGDTISVTMNRLKRKDALSIAPFLKQDDETGETKMSFEDNLKFMDVAAELLPKYLKRMGGLFIEGEELTIKEFEPSNKELADNFIGDVYFIEIISEIIGFLISESFLSDDESKKPESLPGDGSEE